MPPPPPPPPPPVNNPPRITSVTVNLNRVEVGQPVTVTATVTDDETLPANLKYEWTAEAGTFSGSGNVVVWTAPMITPTPLPGVHAITLAVVERYGSDLAPLEHRITGRSPDVFVDDSPKTVRAMSEEFMRDFANNSVTPQLCVRNFSDSATCQRGKQSELEDIIEVRRDYSVQSYTFSPRPAIINMGRTRATVSGRCAFTSIRKKTNETVFPAGTCVLELVNESNRWWMCESSMHDSNSAALDFPF